MKVIARINADGSLLIRGEVFELISSWDEAELIDEDFIIDEDTEIDEDLDMEEFLKILLGIQSQITENDRLYFDQEGNLYLHEVIEDLVFQINQQKELRVNEIIEGVDFNGNV